MSNIYMHEYGKHMKKEVIKSEESQFSLAMF